MSEYQFVHFLAIDRPLDDDQLEFMQRQSTRAEITPWEFTNEYHFGDFHGNAREMLQYGYDVHLHYANFGIRLLMFRLPAGLPCDRKMFDALRPEYGVQWHADKKGPGGVLQIQPEADAGSYEEDVYNAAPVLRQIAPLRNMLIGGDLRPLYLAWLACTGDDESLEPPVPAGLGKLAPPLKSMAKFYEIGQDLISAAADRSPPLSETTDAGETLKQWIGKQSKANLQELVQQLLAHDGPASRAETLARIRNETPTAAWPMAEPSRTLAQLHESASELRVRRATREQKASDAAHRKRLETITADPRALIANVEKLVKMRSVSDYERAAQELADLREALGPTTGPARARAVAEKLRRENPRLNGLVAALRKHGLLG
ncbi:MAG: hypothetical protein ACLP9L_24195 [Thermoguttaceae bacterium]